MIFWKAKVMCEQNLSNVALACEDTYDYDDWDDQDDHDDRDDYNDSDDSVDPRI